MKAVVRMTELVAPFVPVHGSWTFLPDMNCFRDVFMELTREEMHGNVEIISKDVIESK